MAAVTIASEPRSSPLRGRPGPGCRRSQGAGARRQEHPPATYRRRRVVAVGLVAAVALSAWAGVRDVFGASGPPPVRLIGAHVVVVRPGDTLWSIAVAEDPHGNVLALLDRLEAETHDRPLQVGERIVVP